MIVLSNTTAQTIQPGQSVLFNIEKLHTGCAETHRAGSGSARIKGGKYSLEFTGNVGGAAATQPSLAIALDGDVLIETTMTESVTADTDVHNVHASTVVANCFCDGAVTVTNIGTTPVVLQANPALVIKREA